MISDDKQEKKDAYGTFSSRSMHALSEGAMSGSMEDYLEMIFRLSRDGKAVRVKDLSSSLGVSPSSASRMTGVLKARGLVDFEKYGYITLTEEGKASGKYLLCRHETVNAFLCLLNNTSDELIQTEAIEHYLSDVTVSNMERIVKKGSI